MRLGYAPIDPSLQAPGDRRRFVAWAQARGIEFELVDQPRADLDVIVVAMPSDLIRWREAAAGPRIVFDVTDDYLVLPDEGFKNQARGVAKFLSGELSRPTLHFRELFADMCRRADLVICTSPGQCRHVEEVGQPSVRLIIDAYDEPIEPKRDYRIHDRPRIGWEGLPFNLGTLAIVGDAMRSLPAGLRPVMHVVTPPVYRPYARRFGRRSARRETQRALPGVDVVMHDWQQPLVAGILTSCDVAIIPLPGDNAFAMSKSAQKLVSMWALGMPTVTTATEAYEHAMTEAGLDLVCHTTEDWRRALERLLVDEQARRQAGEGGRAYVEAHASREIIFSRWDEAIAAVT